jgi:hypothetical protein
MLIILTSLSAIMFRRNCISLSTASLGNALVSLRKHGWSRSNMHFVVTIGLYTLSTSKLHRTKYSTAL